MMCANEKVHYDPMVVFDYPQYQYFHHYEDQTESIELLKCLSGTFCFEGVSKIKSILSIIFHANYGAVRISRFYFRKMQTT